MQKSSNFALSKKIRIIIMEYRVYIRKGWDTKAIDCKSIDEAVKFARFGAFLLDIKIKKTLRMK